jgi:hypothetical protein
MAWNQLENNVKGTLTTGIDASVTAMVVSLLAGSKSYPAGIDANNPIYLTLSSPSNPLSNEIVKVTAVSGSNVTTMVRAQRDTTARAWVAGTIISINLHAEDLEEMRAYVRADGTYYAPAGTAAAPAFTFTADTDTGLYWKAANQLGVTANGSAVGFFASTGWNGAVVGNVTGNLSGNVTGNVTGNLSGNVVLPAGTEALPSLALTGDLNTGMWSSGADTLDWSTGGTKRLTLSTTALTSTLPYLTADGSAAAPAFGFSGDAGNGMYLTGADTIGFSTGGTLRLSLSTTLLTSTLPLVLPVGAVAAPALYFTGDPNTGFYWIGADQIGATTNGVLRLTISTSAISSTVSYETTKSFYSSLVGVDATPNLYLENGGIRGGVLLDGSGNLGLTRESTRMVDYTASAITMARSAAEFTETRTNYYAGAAHNTITLRATRGTSGTPDYLDADDVVGKIKFEGMDGAGTWGDVAEIRAIACSDHASGDTHGGLHLYATKDGSDTQTKVAGFETYIYAPGVLDLALPRMDTRMITFWDYGSDVGFGYFEDVLAGLSITIPDGVSVFDTANTDPIRIHIGVDDYIYFANSTGTVATDNAYRIGNDQNDNFGLKQYDSGSSLWSDLFHHDGDTIVLDKTVYNDANVGSLVLQTGGTLPGIVQLVDNTGTNTGIYARGWADGEEGSGSIEIPHDYKEGTDLVFHVHWNAQAAPTGTDYVKWNLIYTVSRDGSTIAAAATVPCETAIDTQYKNYRSDFTAITGTNFKIGDQFQFTLARVTAAGDAYAGEAVVNGTIGFHYQCDTIGSRTIAAK